MIFRVSRQRRHGAADEQWRFRREKVFICLAAIAPVLLGHAEPLQHRLGTQEPGGDRDCGDTVRKELGGHRQRHLLEPELDRLLDRMTAHAHRVALGHLDDEAAAGRHHPLCRVLCGDEMGHQPVLESFGGVGQVGIPEPAVSAIDRVLTGHAINDDIEATVLALHARKERFDLGLHRVIHANRDRRATRGVDHLGGLVDRFRPLIRRWIASHTPPGAVDDRTALAERAGDAAAGAAGRAGDHGHPSSERLLRLSHSLRHHESPQRCARRNDLRIDWRPNRKR